MGASDTYELNEDLNYPDNSDTRLIRMYLMPPFGDQNIIIRLAYPNIIRKILN